jgi:tetratricopeptide (TPR) repeat protein
MECLDVHAPKLPMKRVGRDYDGGYVVVDRIGSYDLLLSAGISDDDSFELAFAAEHKGIRAVCFDGSIKALPSGSKELTFVSKNVGRGGEEVERLSAHIGGAENVFLKMDIEGHEWEVFADLFETDSMRKVKQMVVELHHVNLNTMKVLDQLALTHRLCHLHPNNAGSVELVGGVWIPEYLECTYLRLAEFGLTSPDPPFLWRDPASLDMPNCYFKPALVFKNELDPMCGLMNEAIRLEDAKDLPGALAVYQQMLAMRPGDPSSLTNAGLIYMKMDKKEDAIKSLRAAVDPKGEPKNTARVLCDLLLEKVFDLLEAHKPAAALEAAEFAVQVSVECEPAWVALGLSAVACKLTRKYLPFVRVAYAAPRISAWEVLHKVLFVMLADVHSYTEALEASKTVKEWDGPSISAMLVTLMHFGMDVNALEIASQIPPEIKNGEILNLEAGAFVEMGETNKAMHTYAKAHAKIGSKINPNALLTSNSSDSLSDMDVFVLHRLWAEHFDGLAKVDLCPRSASRQKLRVGYIGSDFNEHAVCHFVLGLLTKYNRTAFRVHVYDSEQQHASGRVNAAIRASVDSYVNISAMTGEEAAAKIAQDNLDVLVDLASHTAGTRMDVVARKPARVLACMIGYPNTTGLRCVDYRLTDEIADPFGEKSDSLHTERLVRVPGCMLCYTPAFFEENELPEIVSGPRGIRFGCFAKPCKISDSVWNLWKELMDRLPATTITLKAKVFGDMASTTRFLSRMTSLGVDTKRLRLMPYTSNHVGHLNAFNDIDVSLDTFPYSGTTVTCDSLLMGVPVITLRGSSHRQNVTSSILINAGIPENVCATRAEYIDAACYYACAAPAGGLEGKRALRAKFLASPVCDQKAYVEKIETHFFGAIAK